MEYKTFAAETKQIEDRTVTGLAAITGNVDDGNDRIWRGAFKKTIRERAGRVRHLWMHDPLAPPTAAIRELTEVDAADLPPEVRRKYPDATGGLLVKREYLRTPRGDEILAAIAAGAISEMSFGYDPVKFDFEGGEDKGGPLVRNLRELRLWDTSDVNWGMNSATVASKRALPFRETPKAAPDAEWDGPAEVAQAEVEDLRAMCAWVDPENADNKGGYKLPHHRAQGEHAVVWRGVAAAMAALLGGRGGVDIPDGDRRAVYEHLAKHYAQFDKEPPGFKFVELAAVSRALLADAGALKEGRVLSARNLERLKGALETLQEILLAAEPPDEDEKRLALTVLRRLQFAEREFNLYQ